MGLMLIEIAETQKNDVNYCHSFVFVIDNNQFYVQIIFKKKIGIPKVLIDPSVSNTALTSILR